MNNIKIKKVETEKELNDALEVRRKVFIGEQKVSLELEIDGKDKEADHFLAYLGDNPLGTFRIRYLSNELAKIERMAVVFESRGKGVGGQLMETAISYLQEKNIKEIVLHAQEHAKTFYEKFGFKQEGGMFEDANIPHIEMRKILPNRF